MIDRDLIHHLESGFLTHGLDLADDLTHKALLDKFRCQVRIEHHRHGVISLGHIAFHLRHGDQEILLCQLDRLVNGRKCKHAVCL